MLFNTANLITYRLYLEDIKDIIDLLSQKLDSTYGLILLCGELPENIKIFQKCNMLDGTFALKKGWNILYLGRGKKGYNLPWLLLFQIINKHKEIKYFILSDADGQIPSDQIRDITIHNGVEIILPQRRKRIFGEFTFERNIIEDIENAFIRIQTGEYNILDFQSGLFIMHRRVAEELNFNRIKKHKWIGDLYFLEQVIKNKMNIQTVKVNASENHNSSSIFDYSGPLNEIFMGIPILKMKELVDYTGISLGKIKEIMVKDAREYLPTFFKYNDKKYNGSSINEIKSYLDFIVNLYLKTAEVYKIKL